MRSETRNGILPSGALLRTRAGAGRTRFLQIQQELSGWGIREFGQAELMEMIASSNLEAGRIGMAVQSKVSGHANDRWLEAAGDQ